MQKIPTIFEHDWEGIVFHHQDGRQLAKIKGRDFGLRRQK